MAEKMTAFAAAQITKDRLKLWQKRNEREGIPCTPVALLNVRHDGSTQLVCNLTEDVPLDHVLAVLETAVLQTKQLIRKGN